MVLTIYLDTISQPSRAVLLFAQAAKIPHEVKIVNLLKGEHRKPEFLKMHPRAYVPFIDDDGVRMAESPAIMYYLASKYVVDEHWYPSDLVQRARVHEAVSWHNSGSKSLRQLGVAITVNKVVGPVAGFSEFDEEKLKNDVKMIHQTLSGFEEFFLKDQPFMCGNEVTVADLLTTSEILQPTYAGVDLLSSHPKTAAYIDRVRAKLDPHWSNLYSEVKGRFDGYIADLEAKTKK